MVRSVPFYVVPLLAWGLAVGGYHHLNHDDSDRRGDHVWLKKSDGVFSHTQYSFNRSTGEVSVREESLLAPSPYEIVDREGDGRVDKVIKQSFMGERQVFVRDKDFSSHNDVFTTADRDLAEQHERFAKLLNPEE